MSTKPDKTVEWATRNAIETRLGGVNKIEPNDNLKINGTLDGALSLNNFNFIINNLGLWSQFVRDMATPSSGSGESLSKDGHFSFIVAFDSTVLSNYLIAIADKPTTSSASVNVILNNILTLGAPLSNGTIPVTGGVATNIKAFSLSFKL